MELKKVVISNNLDENVVYNDKHLIKCVKQSTKEARAGKGKILKSEKEMNKYFEAL